MYKIVYVPSARQDLIDIVDYITDTLQNPQAAYAFVDRIEQAVSRLGEFPYSCRVYRAPRPLADEIRVLPAGDYLVFYTVVENAVEIRRVINGRTDISRILL